MPSPPEREPRERETLIFSTPEAAARFREQVVAGSERVATPGVRREREVIAAAVAAEFSKAGEAVGATYQQPWEHTEAEHAAVQQLVDVAFTQDLLVALKAARRRADFPRIVDLFHDVLTGELYDILQQERMTQLRVRGPLLFGAVAAALLLVCAVILLVVGALL